MKMPLNLRILFALEWMDENLNIVAAICVLMLGCAAAYHIWSGGQPGILGH